jgi:hypothetical protein
MHQYVGTPFEKMGINVAESFPRSDQENRYLKIAMHYFTKWPEAYAIPNQEASTLAEALITNFCLFEVPRELYSDHSYNLESRLLQGFAMPGSEQDADHTIAPGIGRNGRGAPTKCRRIAPERLGRKNTNLPLGLQDIHS